MEQRSDLLISGGTIVPMTARGEYFPGDLLIDDGRIVAVSRQLLAPERGDPAARLVNGASAADSRHVVGGGTPVVVDHSLVKVAEDELRDKVRTAWTATRRRMEELT